jgi:hypothetical protein
MLIKPSMVMAITTVHLDNIQNMVNKVNMVVTIPNTVKAIMVANNIKMVNINLIAAITVAAVNTITTNELITYIDYRKINIH